MTMNGHFATGEAAGKEQYEHGVQVIDSEKNFKWVNTTPYHLLEILKLVWLVQTYKPTLL